MLAHLNNGKYNGYQMLDSATVQLMHSDLFSHDKGLRGFCYGFFNLSRNGYRIIGHGGATEYFFSYLKLLPENGYGIFISTNTKGGTTLVSQATNHFVDRYFPDTSTYPQPISLLDETLEIYTGSYLPNRRPFKRMTKLAALTNNPVKVTISEGHLVTSGENRWFPIDSQTFQSTETNARMSFDKDDTGKYAYMYMD